MPSISRPASPSVGDGFTGDAWPLEGGNLVDGSDAAVADPFDGFPSVDAAQTAFDPIADLVDREGQGLLLDSRHPLDGVDGLDGVDFQPAWSAAVDDGLHAEIGPSFAADQGWDGVSTMAVGRTSAGETTEFDLAATDDWSRLDPSTLLPLGSADGFAAQEFATAPIIGGVEAEGDGVTDPDTHLELPLGLPDFLAGDGTAFIA